MIYDNPPLPLDNMPQSATTSKIVVTRLLILSLFLMTMPWANVSANKDSDPYIEIVVTPQQEYYDVVDNESAQRLVRFEIDAYDTEVESSYQIKIALYEEYVANGPSDKIISATYNNINVSITLEDLSFEWINGTQYSIIAELFERQSGEDDFQLINSVSYDFSVGKSPVAEPDPTLVNVEITCDEGWQITQNETRLVQGDQTFVLGCTVQNNNAVRVVPVYVLTQHQDAGIEFEINIENPLIMGNGSTTNFTLEPRDWNLSMIIPNGSVLVQINISADGWQSNNTSIEINYSIIQEILEPPLVPVMILGCTNITAINFNPNATDNDGSCIFPEPEPEPTPPDCPVCNFTYQIPSQVSIDTPATFSADATLTDGWDYYGGATISWDIDGIVVNGDEIEHTFTSVPTGGTTNVTICVLFNSGPENCQEEIISVNVSLAGYISHSSQLEPLTDEAIGAIHFAVEVWGGLAPYSYEWQFDDGTKSTNQSILHEFSEAGMKNVSLVVQDARGDSINLSAQVDIINESKGDDSANIDENQEMPIGPESFGVVVTGGGALLLSTLMYSNGKKKREQILKKGQLLAMKSSSSMENSIWDDSIK